MMKIYFNHLNFADVGFTTEAEKGTIQKYFANPKRCLESISFKQIAFEKFLKSRKQFQILV